MVIKKLFIVNTKPSIFVKLENSKITVSIIPYSGIIMAVGFNICRITIGQCIFNHIFPIRSSPIVYFDPRVIIKISCLSRINIVRSIQNKFVIIIYTSFIFTSFPLSIYEGINFICSAISACHCRFFISQKNMVLLRNYLNRPFFNMFRPKRVFWELTPLRPKKTNYQVFIIIYIIIQSIIWPRKNLIIIV